MIVKQQQFHREAVKTKDRRQSVLCRCTSRLESSSYRAEDHAIDYCIQETPENFFKNFLPSMERFELVILVI